jgi:hypothetical protein
MLAQIEVRGSVQSTRGGAGIYRLVAAVQSVSRCGSHADIHGGAGVGQRCGAPSEYGRIGICSTVVLP